MGIKQYLWGVAVSFDQTANALVGGLPDMTLSGRMGKAIMEGRCKLCIPICWLLSKFDKEHCKKQAVAEQEEWDDNA